jgi:uncharacterized protein YkwD
MRRVACLMLALMGLGLGLWGCRPSSTPTPATSAPTAAANETAIEADQVTAKPDDDPPPATNVDYYALSTKDFFELATVTRRIKKDSWDVRLLEAAVFQQTNVERAKNKLPLLKHGWAMNYMARRHSEEMADLHFFDHTSPNPANATMTDRLRNVGLVNVTAGENIAVLPAREIGSGRYITHDPINGKEVWYDEVTGKRIEYFTYKDLAETVVTQWMNSPHHRDNIVKKEYVYLGVGIARGPYEQQRQDSFYMTQNFCASITTPSEEKSQTALTKADTPAK